MRRGVLHLLGFGLGSITLVDTVVMSELTTGQEEQGMSMRTGRR